MTSPGKPHGGGESEATDDAPGSLKLRVDFPDTSPEALNAALRDGIPPSRWIREGQFYMTEYDEPAEVKFSHGGRFVPQMDDLPPEFRNPKLSGRLGPRQDDSGARPFPPYPSPKPPREGSDTARKVPPSIVPATVNADRHAVTIGAVGVQPQLWVDRPATAVAFYEAAFGARVLHRVGAGEDIVAQLAVEAGAFWVGSVGESLCRYSPAAIGGGTCRMLLVVDDPDTLMRQAVRAGATETSPVDDDHGWRLGRLVDPFGHEWEIGRPPAGWPADHATDDA